MPFYEVALILRPLPRQETVGALKRAANLIWKEDGILRKIDYLGFKKFPFSGRSLPDDEPHNEGDYFIFHISMPQCKEVKILPEIKLDVDFIRASFFEVNDTELPKDYECTLEEELQTPFYRRSVQPLLGNKNVRASVRNFETLKRRYIARDD